MKKYNFNPSIFKAYDIRGKIESEITAETAYFIGLCMAEHIGSPGKIAVGRDVRSHSEMLSIALIKGLIEGGIEVIDIGICPTPICYFSIPFLTLQGSIMITGSHNPPEYNGFKITTETGSLSGKELKSFIERAEAGLYPSLVAGKIIQTDILSSYMEAALKGLEFPKKELRIGIDAMNGSGGRALLSLMSILPFTFISRNCEMSGDFQSVLPEPSTPSNIESLQNFMGKAKLDMVFAFDGDADRVLLITPEKIWYGDDLTLLLANSILPHNPGRKVIFDVKSSFTLEEEIKKMGGEPIIYKTGHSLIKQKMKEENAILAGEMSGHIYINDGKFYPFDDGIYCFLRILEYIAKVDKLPAFPHTFKSHEIKLRPESRAVLLQKIKQKLLSLSPIRVIEIDGIKAYFESSSVLARPSNTEEVIIARIEAKDNTEFIRLQKILNDLL